MEGMELSLFVGQNIRLIILWFSASGWELNLRARHRDSDLQVERVGCKNLDLYVESDCF